MKAKPKRMTVAQIQKRADGVWWSTYTRPIGDVLQHYFNLIAAPTFRPKSWKDYGDTAACALCRSYAPWYGNARYNMVWDAEVRRLCKRFCPLGNLKRLGAGMAPCVTQKHDDLSDALKRGKPVAIKRAARARLFEIAPLLLKFAEEHYMNEGA